MSSRLQMSVYLSLSVREEYAAAKHFGQLPPVRRQEALRRAVIAGLKSAGVDLDSFAEDFDPEVNTSPDRRRRGRRGTGRRQDAPGDAQASGTSRDPSAPSVQAPAPVRTVQAPTAHTTVDQPAAPPAAEPAPVPQLPAAEATEARPGPTKGPDLKLAHSLAALT